MFLNFFFIDFFWFTFYIFIFFILFFFYVFLISFFYFFLMKIRDIIFLSIAFSIVYFSHLFVVWTIECLYLNKMHVLDYFIPLIIIIIIGGLPFIFYFINEAIYCISYLIMTIYSGYFLYIFLISLLIRFIHIFMKFTPWFGLLILFLIPGIISIYGLINAYFIAKLEYVNLKYPYYNGKTQILLLSDIHLGAIYQKNTIKRIVEKIKELLPDIVVITGDLADGSLKVKSDWLSPFNQLTIPILYITGNHELMNGVPELLSCINTTNIKHIGGEQFEFRGINFIGIDFEDNLKNNLENINNNEKGIPNIVICHVPLMTPNDLSKYNIFLFLCGHTHGGQLFPFNIFAYFMNKCFSGLYSNNSYRNHVYVSEGINTAFTPMRIGSNKTFAIITIEGNNYNEEDEKEILLDKEFE